MKTIDKLSIKVKFYKADLLKEPSLDERVIGPTDDTAQIRQYGDNFELDKRIKR